MNKKYVDLKLYSFLSQNYFNDLSWTSLDETFSILAKNNISIVVFTDVNNFKQTFYRNLEHKAKEQKEPIIIFPGIEIIVNNKDNDFKAILVFDNNIDDEQLQNLQEIVANYSKNEKSKGLVSFLNSLKKFSYKLILNFNENKKINIKELKTIKDKINYVICNEKIALIDEIKKEINPNLKIIFNDEHNNWKIYHKPKTYLEISENQEINLDYLFNNLKIEE